MNSFSGFLSYASRYTKTILTYVEISVLLITFTSSILLLYSLTTQWKCFYFTNNKNLKSSCLLIFLTTFGSTMDSNLLFICSFIFSFYSFIFIILLFILKISILHSINHDNLVWHSEANEQLKKRGMFKNKCIEPRFVSSHL